MQLLDLQQVDMFTESLKSEGTRKQYLTHRQHYLANSPPPINVDPKILTKFVISYLTAMKKRGYSYSYRSVAVAAIRHYYKSEDADVTLNWDKITSVLGANDKKYSVEGPTHDQVRLLLNISDIKYRMIILLLASSGMRREGLCQMKLEDMTYLKDYKIYKLRVYPRTSHEYVTYCSPEAAEAVITYLKKEKPSVYLLPGNHGNEYQSPSGLSVMLRRLILQAGLGTVGETNSTHDKIPSVHGFKHFCITQMTKSSVDYVSQNIMTDQSGKLGVGQRYMHDMDDKLLEQYIKAIQLLTINPDTVKTTISVSAKDKEIESLKEQLKLQGEQLKMIIEKQDREEKMMDDYAAGKFGRGINAIDKVQAFYLEESRKEKAKGDHMEVNMK
jgi:integrase